MRARREISRWALPAREDSISAPWLTEGSLLLSAHRSILNLVTNDIGINGVPTYTNGMARLELEAQRPGFISPFSA